MSTKTGRVWLIAAATVAVVSVYAVVIPAIRLPSPAWNEPIADADTPVVAVSYDTVSQAPLQQVYRFVFASDVPNIPAAVMYDLAISPEAVPELFLADGEPVRRALIVSKPLVESVIHPTGGFDAPGGSPEYYAIMNVLWQEHIVVVLDAGSLLLAQRLGLYGVPAPFDPFGSIMPTHPAKDDVLLAATLVAHSPQTSFYEARVSSGATGSRQIGGDFALGRPYAQVQAAIRSAIQTLDS